jgi:MraZ protein
VFLGTHAPRLDDKGRVILPAKFRDPLSRGLVLTKGQDRCVVVWPAEEFTRYAEKLRQASLTNERTRGFTRVFFSSAFDDAPDKQGRVTIPPALRDYAGLTRELVVVGADTRVEIWDATAWQAYLDAQENAFADMDGEVMAPPMP